MNGIVRFETTDSGTVYIFTSGFVLARKESDTSIKVNVGFAVQNESSIFVPVEIEIQHSTDTSERTLAAVIKAATEARASSSAPKKVTRFEPPEGVTVSDILFPA